MPNYPATPAAVQVFDGLGALLTLADEAELGIWSKEEMIDQLRAVIGDVRGALWRDVLQLIHEQPTA